MIDSPLISELGRWAKEIPHERAFSFVDYGRDTQGRRTDISWSELDGRVRGVAAALRRTGDSGQRVAIVAPQSLEYIVGFLGAMYAGMVSVPLFTPDLPGHRERLTAILRDADADCVLTTAALRSRVRELLNQSTAQRHQDIVVMDSIDPAPDWEPEKVRPSDPAYLQYTSGSTRIPAGAVITHGNLAANARQIWAAGAGTPRSSVQVMWLPLFHDMGLVSTIGLPLVHGNSAVLMDPLAFVMRPVRWLQLLSAEQGDTFTAGPNFAYEMLVDRVSEKEKIGLDLSRVKVFMNGAEPVRPKTLKHFQKAFQQCGLRSSAPCAAYGLAEATVYVSAGSADAPPTIRHFDALALAEGVARPCDREAPEATALVACGAPIGQTVAVVDPRTHYRQPARHIGEIWVHGPNVADGYWGRSKETASTFEARLNSGTDASTPHGPWLRTGDLGFWYAGELYVTGRIKDLIIIDGRNHYPQDIEYTAQDAHPGIRPEHVAAFAVDNRGTESAVILAERNRRIPLQHCDPQAIEQAVRTAVHQHHGLVLWDFVLVEPGGITRTSSGKLARAACRASYLAADVRTTIDRLALKQGAEQ
ncbi:fatty acyl-AMP ligase [Actinomadura physcomitrii]|nr:fatty acyl-AMP ligase [Actinomadura physcomitrii]